MNYRDVLLTNENIIKSTTNIFENVNGNYLLPSIKLSQDIDLESVIGTKLLESLQQMVYRNEFKNIYKKLLDNYVQPYLTYSSIVRLIPTVSWKITNAGVMTTSDEKMNPTSANEVDKVKAYYQNIADTYKIKMQRFLIANHNDFPELNEGTTIECIRQNLYSSATSGLALGGARGKIIY